MSFGNRVLTTTNQKIMPMVVDTILDSNVLATRLMTKSKKWAGETMKFPIKYQKNNTGTSFAGFDTFSTSAIDNRVNMAFNPRFYQITCSLPLDEVSVNAISETKILDLVSLCMKSAAQDMADDIGTLFYGNGTGNGNKDFNGLGSIVDDGSVVATYGGLSRSTYPTIAATSTASGGTLTLAKMATLYSAVTSGSQKPTLGVTTETVFNLYESLLEPQMRIVKSVPLMKSAGGSMGKVDDAEFVVGTGATGLYYKGFPIVADEKCTSGSLFFLNENFLQWYSLPVYDTMPIKYSPVEIVGNDYEGDLGMGFSWTDWIKPTNAAAYVSHIYVGGDLVCDNPKRQGKLTGITSV